MEQIKPAVYLFGLLLITIILAAWLSKGNLQKISPKKEISIDGKSVFVEIADTPEARRVGLSGKDQLGESEGMLFVFEENSRPGFWMKGMRFGIDIIWIDDGKVIQISENLGPPEPPTPDDKIQIFTPGQPVDFVIEVKDDFVERSKITVGANVDFKGIVK